MTEPTQKGQAPTSGQVFEYYTVIEVEPVHETLSEVETFPDGTPEDPTAGEIAAALARDGLRDWNLMPERATVTLYRRERKDVPAPPRGSLPRWERVGRAEVRVSR